MPSMPRRGHVDIQRFATCPFQVGDLVRCKVRRFDNETVGQIYRVAAVYRDSVWFGVEQDDRGHPNDYYITDFELASAPLLTGWRLCRCSVTQLITKKSCVCEASKELANAGQP